MSSGCKSVRIEEPFYDGIIVTGLEVIPSRLAGIAVSFSCYLDSKSAEKVAVFFGFAGGSSSHRYYHPRLVLNHKAQMLCLKTALQGKIVAPKTCHSERREESL